MRCDVFGGLLPLRTATARPISVKAMVINTTPRKSNLGLSVSMRPNENKMSHHWRERAWQRDVRLKSWKTWAYAGQGLAASPG